jgi:hypothetical protein
MTIEQLNDPDKPMEIERAKAVATVAQTIINSAKVEVDMAKAVCASSPGSTAFFGIAEESRDIPKLGGPRPAARKPRINGSTDQPINR